MSRPAILTILGLAACARSPVKDSGVDARDRRSLPTGATWFSGDVSTDFAHASAVHITDPGGLDVGVPTAAGGATSGWDLDGIALDYDPSNDTLSVGFATYGVGGDADGDSDEGTTSSWLAGLGGTDATDLGGTESFALAIDLDQDGVLDIIAGVPGDGTTDLYGYTVSTFAGSVYSPGTSFGSPLPHHTGGVFGVPDSSAPHLEFTITDFSSLAASVGVPATGGSFDVYAFMGSFQDAGIGEDFIPGVGTFSSVCVDLDGDGVTPCSGDCDDTDASVFPKAAEACDGVDNNCDGTVDEGYDLDGDGVTTCDGDCDDADPAVSPLEAETCDSVDNDCDGAIDEGFDADGDGVSSCDGDCDDSDGSTHPGAAEACDGVDNDCDGIVDNDPDGDGDGTSACAGDCNDADSSVYPGAPETCDFVDNDCDGTIDDGFDVDGDGFTTCAGDCDDGSVKVNPAATETCNGVDDDCDGTIDNGHDVDGDGFTSCSGDCDDGAAAVFPGATETCNGVDDDCDGTVDDGFDSDGDGVTVCGGDCDDTSSAVYPGAPETCNGADDNCDGRVDETYDVDGDGHTSCDGDCDDTDAAIFPGAAETCDDGVDNDCDGLTDSADTAECTGCDVYTLDVADDYNVFVFGDYVDGVDVQGAVAAGGDVDMASFAINASAPGGDAVVAGADLILDGGTVYGDAWYGGSQSVTSTVTVTGGTLQQGSPIDFVAAEATLQDLSVLLAGLTDTAAASVSAWGAISMSGSETDQNVFTVAGTDLASATSVSISAPAGSVVVVNVTGSSITTGNFAITMSGVDETTILWNFWDATSLTLSSIGWEGSLLAPYADITFNNGNFDGNLIAASLTGSAEGHHFPWSGEVEVCAEPAPEGIE